MTRMVDSSRISALFDNEQDEQQRGISYTWLLRHLDIDDARSLERLAISAGLPFAKAQKLDCSHLLPKEGTVKLNLGCGARILDGYTNVDLWHRKGTRGPDINADVRKVPLSDECADEIIAIHIVEHFYPWELEDEVLPEWHRLLKVGGRLIVELPDVVKACHNVVRSVELGLDIESPKKNKHLAERGVVVSQGLWALYGDPHEKNPLNGHHWGYTPETLGKRLHAVGFTDIIKTTTQWHPVGREMRDMRLECVKG